MSTQRQSTTPNRSVTHLARGLGWFSIALGLTELLMTRKTSRATGMDGSETLVRTYGAREIATGVGLLASRDPTPWLWARVGGDALDIATLANSAITRSRRDRKRALWAIAAVAGVTALDVVCAEAARRDKQRASQPQRDYSDRSGFPLPPNEMRGLALEDFEADADMQAPPALKPYASAGTAQGDETVNGATAPSLVVVAEESLGLR